MADIINYFPNPDLRTTTNQAWILGNDFPNPTPTVDLSHWSAVPGGSITRTADASLFDTTSFGCRVVNGVNLTTLPKPGYGRSVTARVRAVTAMTITGTATADFNVTIRQAGWGEFGWGETAHYEDGAAKTFEAGEVATFRIYYDTQNWPSDPLNYPGVGGNGETLWNPVVTLTGTGTFDVDGIVEWVGVDDGYEENGESFNPPDAPPFFDGDTADANGITYAWVGTPHDSPSVSYGQVPKYVTSEYFWEFTGFTGKPSAVFATTVNGENVAGVRAPIGFGIQPVIIGDENGTLDGLGLTEGKSYALTYDIISTYRNAWYGYWEEQWGVGAVYGNIWLDREHQYARHAFQSINKLPSPYRMRGVLPFTYTSAALLSASIDSMGLDWTSGEVYLTNIGIYEVDILLNNEAWTLTDGTMDLLPLGVVAGGSYHLSVEWLPELCAVRVEYQTGGGGAWTVLAQGGDATATEEWGWIVNASLNFTVPADATAVRFRSDVLTASFDTVNLTTAVPDSFNGDTPESDEFTYSWAGVPGDSISIKSAVPTGDVPEARVFVDGAAVEVTAIRIVSGGTLKNVTEIGT